MERWLGSFQIVIAKKSLFRITHTLGAYIWIDVSLRNPTVSLTASGDMWLLVRYNTFPVDYKFGDSLLWPSRLFIVTGSKLD